MNNQGVATQIKLLQPIIENGDTTKMLQFLQQNDVDVTAVNDVGDTVLHLILRRGNIVPRFLPIRIINMLNIFIGRAVDPNIKNKNQETALHLAIAPRLKDVVDYLLKHKSNINAIDDKGNSVAHYFIKKSCGLFREKQGSELNTRVYNYAETAKKIDSSFVEWLISRGLDFDLKNEEGQSAVHLAVEFNMQHILATLFRNTRDVNFVTEVEKQNLLYLFLKTIDVNDRGNRGVFPQESDHQSILPLFSQDFPSEFAVEIVQILLERGVSVNREDKDGFTPLHLAIRNKISADPNQHLILDLLISGGCDVRAKNCKGETPLHWAARFLDFTVAQKLIAYGADVNSRDYEKQWCPLHEAIYRGSTKLMGLLLENGANVNGKTRDGRPLHLATDNKEKNMVITLLEYKAEVNARDHRGNTALAKTLDDNIHFTWAARDMRTLLEHGADIHDVSVIRLLPRCMDKYIIKFLLEHWIKLRTAKLPCSNEYQTYIVANEEYKKVRAACLREIDWMKRMFIDSRTSIYGWLRMDPNRRHVHNQNEKLKNIVDSPVIKEQFPQYSTVILGTYRDTVARKSLLEPAKKTWLELTAMRLPDLCIEHLFSYLNTGDMFEMVEILNEPV